jgi:hypothetical protein
MDREYPGAPFERYADDVVVHCDTEAQARSLWASLAERLGSLGLELHPEKTKVVYCQDANRRRDAEHTSFDFLKSHIPTRLAVTFDDDHAVAGAGLALVAPRRISSGPSHWPTS